MFLNKNVFPLALRKTVTVAQLVRASDCGSEGRGFETPQSPPATLEAQAEKVAFFIGNSTIIHTIFNRRPS